MKIDNEHAFPCAAGAVHMLPAALLVLILSGCGKSPERPAPPQTPPRPQVMMKQFAEDVQPALFSYSPGKTIDFQNGKGVKIERRVIHT